MRQSVEEILRFLFPKATKVVEIGFGKTFVIVADTKPVEVTAFTTDASDSRYLLGTYKVSLDRILINYAANYTVRFAVFKNVIYFSYKFPYDGVAWDERVCDFIVTNDAILNLQIQPPSALEDYESGAAEDEDVQEEEIEEFVGGENEEKMR